MLRPLHFLALAACLAGSAAFADVSVTAGSAVPTDVSAHLPRVAPESVGMSVSRLAMIDDVSTAAFELVASPGPR